MKLPQPSKTTLEQPRPLPPHATTTLHHTGARHTTDI